MRRKRTRGRGYNHNRLGDTEKRKRGGDSQWVEKADIRPPYRTTRQEGETMGEKPGDKGEDLHYIP